MSQNRYIEVFGPAGLRGSIDTVRSPLDAPTAPGAAEPRTVRVLLDDGRELAVPREALRRRPDGAYALEVVAAPPSEPQDSDHPAVIPVIAEELRVTTRAIDQGGVRIRKVQREREETVNPPLRHEQVTIDRVTVQREVAGPMPIREEDGVVIVPLVEEVVVVRKAWVLREEIRINKRRFEVRRPKQVTLRTEDVIVERLPPHDAGIEPGAQGREPQNPVGPEAARETKDHGKER